MVKKRRKWSHSEGTRPFTCTVFERTPGGPLYARAWDPTLRGGKGNWVRKSLKHRDREKAKTYAVQQAAKLRAGDEDLTKAVGSISHVFTLYERHRTPRKSEGEQSEDIRRAEMWSRWLGGKTDPHRVSRHAWESFQDARISGAIDGRGNRIAVQKARRTVRASTVAADLKWLKYVFAWAVTWEDGGDYLMRSNPVRGYAIPTEKNPRRPVASNDRYLAIRAKRDEVKNKLRKKGVTIKPRSYLSELLDIANGTGRRLSAICQIRFEDLRLNDGTPYGSIRWPADTDKIGRETTVPIGPGVRRALDRIQKERPGIAGYLFPSPKDSEKPVSRHLADRWLREAEKLAGLEPQTGSLWHAFRRKWATERKHLPDVDVAAAGGWADTQALKKCYQHADQETMLHVVLDAGELREAK